MEPLELNNFKLTPKEKQRYDQVEVTMDSGAATPIPQAHCPDKIASQGQFELPMRLDDGRMTSSTCQAAQVCKPFMTVSTVNEKADFVVFDEEGSFIIPGSSKDLISQLRALIQKGA